MRLERFAYDFGGVLLFVLAMLSLLALFFPSMTDGVWLTWWRTVLQRWFGWGSIIVPLSLGYGGAALIIRRVREDPLLPWWRVLVLEMGGFSLLVLLSLVMGHDLVRAEQGMDGGIIGWSLAELLLLALPGLVVWVLVILVLLWSLLSGLSLGKLLRKWGEKMLAQGGDGELAEVYDNGGIIIAPLQDGDKPQREVSRRAKKPKISPEFRKQFKVEVTADEKPAAPLERDERLPPLNLLIGSSGMKPNERHINQRAGLIEQTLAEFGIPAKVVNFQVGPTVTQFAVEPGFIEKPSSEAEEAQMRKVRVSQITSLSRDLALALSAERLRVQAPVPGRPYIGIEVPNEQSTVVRLRPLLETDAFYKIGSPLTIALGRDVSGQPVVADLATMPHLLIAGTTGSGKSVCIAAITTCLAMNNTPEDLRLVMIDPKMVELVRFNGLPHIYGKVETDLERILGVLRWVVAEMDRRYVLLEQSRSRNIVTYNRKIRRRKDGEVLPRIVVLIDELADLMMSAPDATEHSLVRLAQMARATGIHLVVATQRPSTDVVTGLIKANFPARMSFAVASSVDSRVILDMPGAEHLLGKGDMLFLPPDVGTPIRAQGVIVTDKEIERVIEYWRQQYPEEDTGEPPWEEMLAQEAVLADRDDLIERAIELVRQTQRASASMLQRRLRIGYPRAARLIDELEEMGIVGPPQGGGREREVLIDPLDADED